MVRLIRFVFFGLFVAVERIYVMFGGIVNLVVR